MVSQLLTIFCYMLIKSARHDKDRGSPTMGMEMQLICQYKMVKDSSKEDIGVSNFIQCLDHFRQRMIDDKDNTW